MVSNDGLVFTFEWKEEVYKLHRIKTVRRHMIYVDHNERFFASWDDFWHVFNHLEPKEDKHWSFYKPRFIHRDYKRFILKELSRFKSSTKPESWDTYLESWNKWEQLLFAGEEALEIDLSDTPSSDELRYLGFPYSKFNTLQELITHVEKEYLSSFITNPRYNKNWLFTNMYSGKKVVKENGSDTSLEEAEIVPGSILKIKLMKKGKKQK